MNKLRSVWERLGPPRSSPKQSEAPDPADQEPTTRSASFTPEPPPGLADYAHSSRVREAIYQIAEAANSTSSLSELYKRTHQILEGLMPARNFYIALYDPETDTVNFPYFVDEYDPPPTTSESLRGLTGYIYKTGEPLLVTQALFDELIASGDVELVGEPSIDWMGVPLKVKQRTIGVMVMQTYEESQHLTPDDLNMFKFVSNQVAMAIERQRAIEQLRASEERYRTLFENSPVGIYQTTSSGKILMANPALQKMLGASLEDLKKREISKEGFADPNSRAHFLEVLHREGSVFGMESAWIRADGTTLFLRENARRIPHGDDYFIEGTVEDFTDKKLSEIRLLQSAEELSVLHEAAIAASEESNEDALIARVTRVIGDAIYSDNFGVLLYDPELNALRPHFSYHGIADEDVEVVIPLGTGVTGIAAQAGQPALIRDIHEEPAYLPSHSQPMRSELCVPIKTGNRLLGMINTESVKPDAFSASDLHLMTILAGTLSTAIDRFRTQAAEHVHTEQLASIYEISQEIVGAHLDPEVVYDAIHNAVKKVMPCEAFIIGLKHDSDHVDAVYNFDRSGRYPQLFLDIRESMGGYVIMTGETIFIRDYQLEEAKYPATHYGDPEHVRSILVVPLKVGNEIIGALSTQSYQKDVYTQEDLQMLQLLAAYAAIALGNSKLYNETLLRAEELSVLVSVSSALRIAATRGEMFPIILDQISSLLKLSSAALALKDPAQDTMQVELGTGSWENVTGAHIPIGAGKIGAATEAGMPIYNFDIRQETDPEIAKLLAGEFVFSAAPLLAQEETIGALWVGRAAPLSPNECKLLMAVSDIAANAMNRSALYEQTLQHAGQLAVVNATGRALAETLDVHQIARKLAQSICDLVPFSRQIWISLFGSHKTITTLAYEIRRSLASPETEIPQSRLPQAVVESYNRVSRTLTPEICNEGCQQAENFAGEPAPQGLYVPVVVKGAVLGVIRICGTYPLQFSAQDAELLTLVANTAGIAIENARLFKETEQRLNRLSALRAMDMAISSSFDLRVTLNVLLDQITTQLDVDAADVLLYNEYTQALEYAAGKGFRNSTISRSRLRLDEDLPGKAALERRLVSLEDFPQFTLHSPRLAGESFEDYYGMPLVAKGQLKGVLEIFHRSLLEPDHEWLEFLETLAGDTAIAIDSTTLFNDLQRSNIELTLAYDTTLEGWSRLLELRRLEPAGHTQRILDFTLRLAVEMNVSEAELLNIRRGVLLHDIGIMGLPRHILQKPGPLTDEEWNIVKMHPVYAYDVLLPITYLRSAIEIPYCHHERWDGSGYPRGLKGNQIPLSARIFAVVDVWDALRTERPYRSAWSDRQAIEYIQSQSGILFDPQVVQVLLRIINGG